MQLYDPDDEEEREYRYNPCFSGSSSATEKPNDDIINRLGYNPCFSGSSSATKGETKMTENTIEVTILVFLAALVQPKIIAGGPTAQEALVTILVFLAALVQHRCGYLTTKDH